MSKPKTLGELKRSGYRPRTVKEEMRQNLIRKLQAGERLFPGIIGYEDTVLPQIENAILSGHDMVLLGERGQAKTRIARSLVTLLDEEIPAVEGCEINDDPFKPICRACRERLEEMGDDLPITWLDRSHRYSEKLATPDTTISDLIGEVDPIKVAEGRYLSSELTIHYGLVPRTNRGIFCINELPDLAERIQVGLLNILEEKDVQIRGYKIRLPLDLYVVASANPEDYTNRGRIITPLKDRFGSEIRTHYPKTLQAEIAIMDQERTPFETDSLSVNVPDYMKEIVAEITHLARRSGDISQRSGVSVRVSICNYENIISSAVKRAIILREPEAVPRISDLSAVLPSTSGKIELETVGDVREDKIVEKIVQGAVLNVFNRRFRLSEFQGLLASFENGLIVEASPMMPSAQYVQQVKGSDELRKAVNRLGVGESPACLASAMEFILEGLHLHRKLNKDRADGQSYYRR